MVRFYGPTFTTNDGTVIGSQSIEPSAGLLVEVGDGDDQDDLALEPVDNAVGKPSGTTTATVGAEGVPGLGHRLDPFDGRTNLRSQFLTESGALRFVIADRLA